MKVTFSGADLVITSVGDLGHCLDRFDGEPQFELWIVAPGGQMLAMLRNQRKAWLTYLRFAGDSGVVTRGDQDERGSCTYPLANGEINEIPLSWCVDLEQCYKAIAYFFVNDGARYDRVPWQTA